MIERILTLLAAACVIGLLLIITGCTRTVYVDRPIEVKVQVPTPCLEPGDVPAPMIYPVDQLQPGVSDGDLIGALHGERKLRAKMEDALREVLAGCVGGSATSAES